MKQDEEQLDDYIETDAEIILEKLEEEQNALFSDDSEDEAMLDLNLWPDRLSTKTSVHSSANDYKIDNFNEIENWR